MFTHNGHLSGQILKCHSLLCLYVFMADLHLQYLKTEHTSAFVAYAATQLQPLQLQLRLGLDDVLTALQLENTHTEGLSN